MNNFLLSIDSPENCGNFFRFEFQSPLVLDGSWTVALCEFSYINQFANVKLDENVIRIVYTLDGGEGDVTRREHISIPMGNTRSVSDLARSIQNIIRGYDKNVHVKLEVDPASGKFSYRLPRHWSLYFHKGSLTRLFGFHGHETAHGDELGVTLLDRGEAPLPMDLYGGNEVFHVKCDFVEANTWVNAYRKTILAANISLELADPRIHIRASRQQPHYVSVNRQSLQTLTFTLENDRGEVVNISHRSHFLLHFKKLNLIPFLQNV